MLNEFKEFAMTGNVVEMAVGIIFGGAFGKIVSSLVNDMLMPPIGLVMGKMDFSRLAFKLHSESKLVDGKEVVNQVAIRYGAFLSTVVDFLIVAFVIFLVVKAINRLKRQQEAPAAAPSTRECPHCISSVSVKATRCPHCTSLLKAA